jgi:hypothetical protein
MDDLCPICIEHPATYFTECNHGYCIRCLSHIKKCSICRHPLQRAKLCVEVKQIGLYEPPGPFIYRIREEELPYFNSIIPLYTDIHTSHPNGGINVSSFAFNVYSFPLPGYRPSGTVNMTRIERPEEHQRITVYSSADIPEEHQPSGTQNMSRFY